MFGYGFRNVNRSILGAGGVGASYLLDTYGSAKVAFALHQLSSTATLSCRVRRSSDNAEQDIGFVGGELDTTSLLSFVGANDGLVVKMYDQSGNGNNASQTTGSSQNYIVQSGVLSTYSVNGKPVLERQNQFSGYDLDTPFLSSSEHTVIGAFDLTGNTENHLISGNTLPYPLQIQANNNIRFYDTAIKSFGVTTGGEHIITAYRKSTSAIGVYVDGSVFGSELTGSTLSSSNLTQIFDRANTANEFASSAILWESDLSANITDISTILNNYYSIY